MCFALTALLLDLLASFGVSQAYHDLSNTFALDGSTLQTLVFPTFRRIKSAA